MSLFKKGNEPTEFQLADGELILADADKFKAPKIGGTVNVVCPEGPLIGKTRLAQVLEVREEGRQIDAKVIAALKDEAGNEVDLILRGCPYVSPARLQLKLRLNTWHYAKGGTKADGAGDGDKDK